MRSFVFSQEYLAALITLNLNFWTLNSQMVVDLLFSHLFQCSSWVLMAFQRTSVNFVPNAVILKVINQISILIQFSLSLLRSFSSSSRSFTLFFIFRRNLFFFSLFLICNIGIFWLKVNLIDQTGIWIYLILLANVLVIKRCCTWVWWMRLTSLCLCYLSNLRNLSRTRRIIRWLQNNGWLSWRMSCWRTFMSKNNVVK